MKQPPEDRFAERVGLSPFRIALMYGAMVVGAVVLFLAIDSRGGRLVAPGPRRRVRGARPRWGASPTPWSMSSWP